MRNPTVVRRGVRLRPVHPAGWWFDLLLLAGLAALTVALARGLLLDVDLAVRRWAYAHQSPPLHSAAVVLNFLGQGGWLLLPVSGALAGLLALRTRSARPLLAVVSAFLLTYLTIGPLKLWTDRLAPSAETKEPFVPAERAVGMFNDQLPPHTEAMSYPSGHVANAIVWYGVIALLLAALTAGRLRPAIHRLIRLAPPVVVLATTTYLNHHWLTDGLAAILLGLLLDRLLTRVPWDEVPLPALPRGLARPAGLTSP